MPVHPGVFGQVESPVRRYPGYPEVDQGQSVRLLGFAPAESKKGGKAGLRDGGKYQTEEGRARSGMPYGNPLHQTPRGG